MGKLILVILGVLAAALVVYACFLPATQASTSDVKDDETVVFFRTTGWLDADSDTWQLPIHGWIYEPEDSMARRAAFEAVLERQYGLRTTPETEANFSRRLNLLIADNERNKRIVISLAGREYALSPSEPNGHFATTISVPAAELDAFGDGSRLAYSAVMSYRDSRSFDGEILLLGREGVSVISDIDDTVKLSYVTDRRALLEQTFFRDFEAAPGMVDLYSKWAQSNASFHFVSSSPWQLYAPLREFLDDNDFPWASLSLKLVRFRDETLFDLFKKGTETKPPAIEAILQRYPERKFVLVGDSGEQDPEVYAEIMRRHPEQVLKIYIRNVTGHAADSDRFVTIFAGIDPSRWVLFDDPAGLSLPEFTD